MRFKPCLTRCLLLAVSLSLVSACASKAPPTFQTFPPVADLQVRPKPQLAPADLGSEAALDAHDIALEAWGEAGWRAVGRICRWAVTSGAALPFDCPPPPPDS